MINKENVLLDKIFDYKVLGSELEITVTSSGYFSQKSTVDTFKVPTDSDMLFLIGIVKVFDAVNTEDESDFYRNTALDNVMWEENLYKYLKGINNVDDFWKYIKDEIRDNLFVGEYYYGLNIELEKGNYIELKDKYKKHITY